MVHAREQVGLLRAVEKPHCINLGTAVGAVLLYEQLGLPLSSSVVFGKKKNMHAQRGIGLLHDMPIHVGLVDKNEFARFARRDDMWCGVV